METTKTRRIGSMTFGLVLVIFGCLFLLHIVLPWLDYIVIFRLWPCIFIVLGIEILIGNKREGVDFRYDKAAIFLIIVLTLFAMCLAGADIVLEGVRKGIEITI